MRRQLRADIAMLREAPHAMSTDTLAACERLTASREHLRLVLQGKAAADGGSPAPDSTPAWMAPLFQVARSSRPGP